MAILHIIRQSAFNSSDLEQCSKLATKVDTIVLIDDACYNVTHPLIKHIVDQLPGIAIKIMHSHAQARAISIVKPITAIAMNDLIDLTFSHEKVITWQ